MFRGVRKSGEQGQRSKSFHADTPAGQASEAGNSRGQGMKRKHVEPSLAPMSDDMRAIVRLSTQGGIMDMDGHANAWGLYWRIAGGSVVFKVESNWTNGYIRDLIPSGEKQNYFKIKQDLSDMINVTRLVTRNDTNSMILMKRVSHNARELARKHSYHNEVARVARELAHVFEEHEKIDDLRYRSGDIREDEAHQTDHKQQHVPGYTDGER